MENLFFSFIPWEKEECIFSYKKKGGQQVIWWSKGQVMAIVANDTQSSKVECLFIHLIQKIWLMKISHFPACFVPDVCL